MTDGSANGNRNRVVPPEPVLSGDRWIQVDLLGQMTPTEGNGVSNV